MNLANPSQDMVEFANREGDVRRALAALIFGGVFERYPALKVGAVEFEIAWAPYFMNRMDNVYSERAQGVTHRRFEGVAQVWMPCERSRLKV
jgi:hypothetical protein